MWVKIKRKWWKPKQNENKYEISPAREKYVKHPTGIEIIIENWCHVSHKANINTQKSNIEREYKELRMKEGK